MGSPVVRRSSLWALKCLQREKKKGAARENCSAQTDDGLSWYLAWKHVLRESGCIRSQLYLEWWRQQYRRGRTARRAEEEEEEEEKRTSISTVKSLSETFHGRKMFTSFRINSIRVSVSLWGSADDIIATHVWRRNRIITIHKHGSTRVAGYLTNIHSGAAQQSRVSLMQIPDRLFMPGSVLQDATACMLSGQQMCKKCPSFH